MPIYSWRSDKSDNVNFFTHEAADTASTCVCMRSQLDTSMQVHARTM